MTRLLLASGNRGKLAEINRILAPLVPDLELLSLADLPDRYPEPAETERTFLGNAALKARAGLTVTGIATIADDSGLCVDELNGMPGVRSARWAGVHGSGAGRAAQDEANNELLLAQLLDLADDRRAAHFECAVVACLPGGEEVTATGRMPGRIARSPAGRNGFGYDPIFVPQGHTVTSAELDSAAKDALSHRGQALRTIAPNLAAALRALP